MQFRFWFRLMWLVLCPAAAAVAEPAQSHCNSQLCWQIEPTVCIAEQSSDSCKLDFQLSWHSSTPVSVCAELAGQSLHCWQQQASGRLRHQTELDGPTLLSLHSDGKQVLTQELSVLSRQPNRRKRLVAPWSVF